MFARFPQARRWLNQHAERVIYRVGGLPVGLRVLLFGAAAGPAAALRTVFAAEFWDPQDLPDLLDIILAGAIVPLGLIAAASWYTWKNGAVVCERCGKSIGRQFMEELRAYFSAGVLPPWYYMFELYDGRSEAGAFINRFESKQAYYPILRRRLVSTSELNDKAVFAQRCREYQLRTVPVIATAIGGNVAMLEGEHLPPDDLFVKPIRGRGGKGAERWDHLGAGRYSGPDAEPLDGPQLLERLRQKSRSTPQLVQPRVKNCAELQELSNGALSTLRILTCLDETRRPEVIAGVMRMAVGENHQVDNFHAGGIAAPVDLANGRLGSASNLGTDCRLGWIDRHPDSGAPIAGRTVPGWRDACALAERAHLAFDDRAIIGWDIAVSEAGPIIVEGNAGPDLDIMQRAARSGMANGRLGELLLFHLTSIDAAASAS
jgi:hypothetical protein